MKTSAQRKEPYSDDTESTVPLTPSGLTLIQSAKSKRRGLSGVALRLLKNPLILSAAVWLGLLLLLIRVL
jgi:hypothetical protein